MKNLCPCKSNETYEDCCKKYHNMEKFPENALKLMRSRFSAYALSLVDYIISTTSKKSNLYDFNIEKWQNEIIQFSKITNFKNLEILAFYEKNNFAYVIYYIELVQNNQHLAYSEKGYFEKINSKWYFDTYLSQKGKNKDFSSLINDFLSITIKNYENYLKT